MHEPQCTRWNIEMPSRGLRLRNLACRSAAIGALLSLPKIINIKQLVAPCWKPLVNMYICISAFLVSFWSGQDKTRLEETCRLVVTGRRLHVPGLGAQEISG